MVPVLFALDEVNEIVRFENNNNEKKKMTNETEQDLNEKLADEVEASRNTAQISSTGTCLRRMSRNLQKF